jgi:hypothetical protein
MPNYKVHLVGGAGAFGCLYFALRGHNSSLLTGVEWFVFALAGALFPDIDIKSKGQKYFYRAVVLIFAVMLFKKQFETMACFSFIIMTPMLVKHRGIFHRLWFIVSMPLLVWGLVAVALPHFSSTLFFNTLFFIAGGVSHIVLDMGFRRMLSNLLGNRSDRKTRVHRR